MLKKLSNHPLLAGSFLLTCTGLISRFIGFFYRIYLSRLFGEEGMGIYQLTGPVMALSFSLTAAGFQTAISKFVAETTKRISNEKSFGSAKPMFLGLSISLSLSVLIMLLLLKFCEPISLYWIKEPRTVPMIRIMALSIPLSAVHACINGYFYGLKRASVPALSQIIEQCSRVLTVYLCSSLYISKGLIPPLQITVFGLLVGEFVSTLLTIAFFLNTEKQKKEFSFIPACTLTYSPFFAMVLPLIANRVTLNALLSYETVSLPASLRQFGYDATTALSVYGVLTGMALPLLFFPNAVTGSIAVLLLPLISEETAKGNTKEVRRLTLKTIQYCSLLGLLFMAFFLLFGKTLGEYLFHSQLAGIYITGLSFICPFLYLNNTLSAILQGIGKVIFLFLVNVFALLIRLSFVYLCVPFHGMKGYLWGLLTSQIFTAVAYILVLSYKKNLHPKGRSGNLTFVK